MGQRTNPSQGLGRLAKAIVGFNHRVPNLKVVAVDTPRNADVVVYCRKSEATLKQATEYCSSTGAALIFLSSGLQINKLDTSRYPFIRVPNSALTVINYLSLVETQAKDRFADWVPKIIEHHQVSKADVSGTAKKLADMLGVEYDMIESIREFERTKKQYNIPKSSQDGYAVHSVTFTDPITGAESDPIEIIIHGRLAYASGVFDIYKAMQNHPQEFQFGSHDIVDLVRRGIVTPA